MTIKTTTLYDNTMRFKKNRVFVVGHINGEADLLKNLLDELDNYYIINKHDTVVFTGNYFGEHGNNFDVFKNMDDLISDTAAKPILLLGPNEAQMSYNPLSYLLKHDIGKKIRQDYFNFKNIPSKEKLTYKEFSALIINRKDELKEIVSMLQKWEHQIGLKYFYEGTNFFVTPTSVNATKKTLAEQELSELIWHQPVNYSKSFEKYVIGNMNSKETKRTPRLGASMLDLYTNPSFTGKLFACVFESNTKDFTTKNVQFIDSGELKKVA